MLIFAHNEEADPEIQCHRCTNTCVSRVNTDKTSWKEKKGARKSSHTLTVLFLSVFFLFFHSCQNVKQRASHEWKKKEKMGMGCVGGGLEKNQQ